MSHSFMHVWSGKSWKIACRWVFRVIVLACVFFIVSVLPKPSWFCDTNSIRYHVIASSLLETPDFNFLGEKTSASKQAVIGPGINKIFQQFPIYMEQKYQFHSKGVSEGISQKLPSGQPVVNLFYLQNFNFSQFGRAWLNKRSEHDEFYRQNFKDSQFVLKMLQHQKLPDCVPLKVPRGATRTKICVHYPHDDNFISNRLRDEGTWEMELVFQLADFFRDNPQSQIVDLGCNVGVFTLFAASLGKPVLAVDILPANLALIQLSVAINDDHLEQVHANSQVLHLLGYDRKTRPKYSDLITTVNNAVYSRPAKMYVYLKDDPNLGGTEVKELNIQEDSIQNIDQNNIPTLAGKVDQHEMVTHLQDKHRSDSTVVNTQIFVDAVCLDDLIPYVPANLSVFLKMDIEGSEPDVFLCASNFFMHVDIRVILMEVLFHRYSNQGKKMVHFLVRHNMIPSEDVNGRKLLDIDHMYNWPENMFWIKVR